MRYQLLFCCLFYATLSFSQEKSISFSGRIIINKIPQNDVHILNKNNNKGTISNDKGWFEIPVTLGDSIYFSHINLQEKLIIITQKHLKNKNSIVTLKEQTYALEEFVLEKPKSIFYVDPQMVPPITVNAKTLKLPYANTKAKKDKSIVKLRSGGIVNLDNLINSLNGNNRREKLLKKLADEDDELKKIRKLFTDDFFITDLKIKKEYINLFLNDCIDKNIIRIFKSDNMINLTQLLINESKLYPYKIVKEDSLLTKK